MDREHFAIGGEREDLGDVGGGGGQVIDDTDAAVPIMAEEVGGVGGDGAGGVTVYDSLCDLIGSEGVIVRERLTFVDRLAFLL